MCPAFVVTLDKIDTFFISFGIEVSPIKVVPVPFKVVVSFLTSVKSEMSPTIDFKRFADYFGTVLRVNFYHIKGFKFIRGCLVVEHNIGHRDDTNIFELVDGIKVFFLETIFGAYGSFLVEFPKVKEVIDSVTNIIFVSSFESRWHPNMADAKVC